MIDSGGVSEGHRERRSPEQIGRIDLLAVAVDDAELDSGGDLTCVDGRDVLSQQRREEVARDVDVRFGSSTRIGSVGVDEHQRPHACHCPDADSGCCIVNDTDRSDNQR